jgi:hypothetical protein
MQVLDEAAEARPLGELKPDLSRRAAVPRAVRL